ncbi:hypothetical protein [uncultured Duncaniella sp.]|uniref:hypothetical protein n=1 Tax=uncultured Duncaniella sp. TaxID=2768039 RepID=UPI00260D3CDD|nr:hypothetical protein [uncultured Duncaniella sp.]
MSRNMVEASSLTQDTVCNSSHRIVADRLFGDRTAILLLVMKTEITRRLIDSEVVKPLGTIHDMYVHMGLTREAAEHLNNIHAWCYRHQSNLSDAEYVTACHKYVDACKYFKVNSQMLELKFGEEAPLTLY